MALVTLPAEFGVDEAEQLLPCILKLDEFDKRSVNRLGNPQNLARNLLMANITLQFLFHPNVFGEPKEEAARLFNLLYAEACVQEKKDAFRETFPRYVTTSRHLGTVHPPMPEIPEILSQFWDGAMERYRVVYKIKRDPNKKKTPGKDGEPHKLKPLVQKIIEMERRRKREEAKAAAAGKLPGQSTGNASASSGLCAMTKSTVEAVKGPPESKRSATWGAFNKFFHPKKARRQQKSMDVDGSVDEESFAEEAIGGENSSGTKNLQDRATSIMGAEAGPSLIEMAEEDEAKLSPSALGVDDEVAHFEHIEYAENKSETSHDRVLHEPDDLAKDEQNEDEGPHQEFQRLKLDKEGSMEVVISTDEADDKEVY